MSSNMLNTLVSIVIASVCSLSFMAYGSDFKCGIVFDLTVRVSE